MNTIAHEPASAPPTPASCPVNPPVSPEAGEAGATTEEAQDFAALLAASWFSLTPPAAATTSQPTAIADQSTTAATTSSAAGGHHGAFPAGALGANIAPVDGHAAAAALTPLASALNATGTAAATTAVVSVEAANGAPGEGELATTVTEISPTSAEATGTAQLPPTSDATVRFRKFMDELRGEFSASDRTAHEVRPLRAEAMRRDSVSVATILAESSRLAARPSLVTTAMKSFLSDGADSFAESELHPSVDLSAIEAQITPDLARFKAAGGESIMRADESSLAFREVIDQMGEPLADAFEKLSPREARTLHVRLNPEELGRVELQVTRDAGGRLSAQLTAEHEAARRALQDGLAHLRDTLERAGIAVEQLNVGVDAQTSSQSFADRRQELQESAQRGSQFASAARGAMRATDEEGERRSPTAAADRLVSVRV